MSENTLVAKISTDTKAVVDEIKSAGQSEVESIHQATKAKLAALEESHRAVQQKKHDHIELVAVSRAKQAGHIALQTAKRKQIDAIFAELQAELASQSSEEYTSFFTKYAKEVIDEDLKEARVKAPANREAETKEILDALKISGNIKASNNITAGFILNTEGGVYDVTLERMLSGRRADLEMEIVKEVMK